MKEIQKADELVAIAVRNGVPMSCLEAKIVLGYMEGHDFSLLAGENFTMKLHDNQCGDQHDEDEEYTVRDAVEFCVEMNGELLQEAEGDDSDNLLDLMKDEALLDALMQKVNEFVPPRVKEYKVNIIEALKKTVIVEAASWNEARDKVERAWKNGEHILDADNFSSVMFNIVN